MANREKNLRTFVGTIMATDWDDDNYPTEMTIENEEGVEAIVDTSDIGSGLLKLDGAEVKIVGILDTSDPDYFTLSVDTFEVINDPYADDFEDEDEFDDEEDWDSIDSSESYEEHDDQVVFQGKPQSGLK